MTTTQTWNGNSDLFTTAADWSGGVVPSGTNGDAGLIGSGTVAITSQTLAGFELLVGNTSPTSGTTLALTSVDFGVGFTLQDTAPINGVVITNVGTSTNDGTISLTSGGVDNFNDASAASTFVNAADGTVTVNNTELNLNTSVVQNNGSIAVANAGAVVIDIANTGTAALQGTGTISLAGASSLNDAAASTASGLTVNFTDNTNDLLDISNAATFAARVTGFQANNVIDLVNVPTIDSATWANNVLTLSDAGSVVATLDVVGSYATSRFVASSDGISGTNVQLAAVDVWNGATADIGTGADWSLGTGPSAGNGYTAQVASGTVEVTGQTLDHFLMVIGDPASANIPQLALSTVDLGPHFTLQDSAPTAGFFVSVAGTLVNDGTINLTSATDVATINNAGSPSSFFTNAADGVIAINAAQLQLNTTVVENDAAIGISNGGAIGIDFNNSNAVTLQGSGSFNLATGGTLDDYAGATTSTLTVNFADATSDTLLIANAGQFAARVTGMQVNNVIDLASVPAATSAVWSNNTLSVMNGTSLVAALNLVGSYATTRFLVGSDGVGGTTVQVAPVDVWNGATADIGTGADWSLGVIPGISNGYTAQIGAGEVQVTGQTLDGFEILIGTPPVTSAPTLALSGVTFGPNMVVQDTPQSNGFNVLNTGTSTNTGTISLTNGGVDNVNDASAASTFANAAGGIINVGTAQLDLNTSVVVNSGTINIANAGAVDIDIANTGTVAMQGTGTVNLSGASSFNDAAASTASGLTVNFTDSTNDVLYVSNASSFAAAITGFQVNNQIDLVNVGTADTASFANNLLTITNAGSVVATLDVVGSYAANAFSVVPDGVGGTYVEVACFASGTRIATTGGAVAVEHLAEGDAVVTLLGGDTASVKWIGRRHVNIAGHPQPDRVRPVRIAAGAFGPGLPLRDLRLSPEHAVFVDGVLIPAGLLVNATSITQPAADRVAYFHVELTRHDVLLAEGLPAESWLDTGNRHIFANAPVPALAVAHFAPDTASAAWTSAACAALVTEGPVLAAVQARLRAVVPLEAAELLSA